MNSLYRVNVALGGDLRHVVVKEGVSVPEIAVLRYIHSDAAITNITLTDKKSYNSSTERERLGKHYKDEKIVEIFGPYGEIPLDIKELKLDPILMGKGDEPPINKAQKKNVENKEE